MRSGGALRERLPLIWNVLPNSQFPPPVGNSSHTGGERREIPSPACRESTSQIPTPTACREFKPYRGKSAGNPNSRRLSGIRDSHGDFVPFCGGWSAEAAKAKKKKLKSKLRHPTSTSTFQIPKFPIPTVCREIPIPAAAREIPIPAAGREFDPFRGGVAGAPRGTTAEIF